MTRSLKTLVLLTALLTITLGASAALITPPTDVLLSNLAPGGDTVTLGGLTFSDFEAGTLGGAPGLDDITLSLKQTAGSPNIVDVKFVGVWEPALGETMDTGLSFLVTADPDVSLVGASLSMLGVIATGDAKMTIVENIFEYENGPLVSSLGTRYDPNNLPLVTSASDTFAPQGSVWVYKDIAAVNIDGWVHLSGVGQSFETDVPEPASISLLAVGALAMLKRRRKK
jgi:hypothetical protein